MYVHIVDVFVYVVLAFGCLHPCNIKWYFTVVACVRDRSLFMPEGGLAKV